jgi:SAM-dependent methyltransferase
MNDPWFAIDKPYRLFSQFCDSDDWHIIVKAVAGALVRFSGKDKENVQLSFLDVGCGNGAATQTVCEQIYALTGCFPALYAVEPSRLARGRLANNVLAAGAGGPLKAVFEDLEHLAQNLIFDAAIFLHSTYYIEDLASRVQILANRHLRSKGLVAALVLSESSPFFLGLPPLHNCSDEVERTFGSIGLTTKSFVLRSRFIMPRIGGFSDGELEALRMFMAPGVGSVAAFSKLLDHHAGSRREMDFQDHLIVGMLDS